MARFALSIGPASPAVPDTGIGACGAACVSPVAEDDDEEEGARYLSTDTPAGRLRHARRADAGEAMILVHGFGGDGLALDLPGDLKQKIGDFAH
jgi:hypothetical protein